MTDKSAGVSEGRRVFTMAEPQGAAFDLFQDFGVPASLDAMATVCRIIAKWHREDREIKYAKRFERLAEKLHDLSKEMTDGTG